MAALAPIYPLQLSRYIKVTKMPATLQEFIRNNPQDIIYKSNLILNLKLNLKLNLVP